METLIQSFDNNSLIPILILLLVGLNLTLIFFYLLEYNRNQKLLGIDKKSIQAQKDYQKSQASANALLSGAVAESETIIDRSYSEANEVVSKLRQTTAKINEITQKEMTALVAEGKLNLQKNIADFSLTFKKTLTELGKTNTDQVKSLQTQIYQESLSALKELIANLRSQAMTLQAEAGQEAQDQLKKMQTDIDQFKTQEMAKIENNLYDILVKAAQSVLGEGLAISVEKETVLKAIAEAKRNGLIS